MAVTSDRDNINIDLDKILRSGRKGILRASAFVGFSLNSANRADLTNFHAENTYLQHVPESLPEERLVNFKDGYRKWAVNNGIRELVESHGLFLNTIYFSCRLFHAVTRREKFDAIQLACQQFEQLSELRKLKKFQNDLGFSAGLETQIESIIKARNSITHRWSKVVGESITVNWRCPQVFILYDDGSERILTMPINEPISVRRSNDDRQDGDICIRFIDKSRNFSPDSLIEFEINEFQEICWTFDLSLRETIKSVKAYASGLGIKERSPIT